MENLKRRKHDNDVANKEGATVCDVLRKAFVERIIPINKSVISAGEIELNTTPLQHDIIHAINILNRKSDEFRIHTK